MTKAESEAGRTLGRRGIVAWKQKVAAMTAEDRHAYFAAIVSHRWTADGKKRHSRRMKTWWAALSTSKREAMSAKRSRSMRRTMAAKRKAAA